MDVNSGARGATRPTTRSRARLPFPLHQLGFRRQSSCRRFGRLSVSRRERL